MLCAVIDILCLLLDVVVCDERWPHLLVAILCELVLESLGGIHSSFNGSDDLKLIIDEEVNVFFHRLFVDDTLGIVFVVRVLEFRPCYGHAVDGHDCRIALLSERSRAHGEHGKNGLKSHDYIYYLSGLE